jgi:hypothetical protein
MKMQLMGAIALSVASMAVAAPAHAFFFYDGSTAGQPTWNRPEPNSTLPPDTLSNFATDTPYQSLEFLVDTNGSYNISALSNPVGWPMALFLYENSFDPAQPLTNVRIGDIGGIGATNPQFSIALMAGVQYSLVATGFFNNSSGTYTNFIDGPGQVTPVPVPPQVIGTLLLAGLAAGKKWQSRKAAFTKSSVR